MHSRHVKGFLFLKEVWYPNEGMFTYVAFVSPSNSDICPFIILSLRRREIFSFIDWTLFWLFRGTMKAVLHLGCYIFSWYLQSVIVRFLRFSLDSKTLSCCSKEALLHFYHSAVKVAETQTLISLFSSHVWQLSTDWWDLAKKRNKNLTTDEKSLFESSQSVQLYI